MRHTTRGFVATAMLLAALPVGAFDAGLPEESASYDLESGEALSIENFAGDIELQEWDETFVLVEYDAGGLDTDIIRIEVDTSRGVYYEVVPDFDEIENSAGSFRWSIDFSVAVPSGVELDVVLSTISGDVLVEGGSGSAEINAVSGDVTASGFDGPLEVNVVSGDLAVSDCTQVCCAAVVSGDMVVDLTGITRDCELDSVDGDIAVSFDPDRCRIAISSLSGDIDSGPHDVEIEQGLGGVSAFAGEGTRRVEISTISGDVILR